MTPEQIAAWAREAGIPMWKGQPGTHAYTFPDELRRFAALVAAHERKTMAAAFMERAKALGVVGTGCEPHIQAQYEAIAGELIDQAAILSV